MDDHAVSQDREGEFKTYSGSEPSSRELKEAATRYFQTEIRWADQPAFLRPSNRNNRIPFTTGDPGKPGWHPGHALVRVLNLTGLRLVFLRNIDPLGEFRELQGHEDDVDYFRRWLADRCQSAPGLRDRFVDATLRMLNEDRRTNRYHPVWATRWEDFAPFASDGPNRWRQALGIRRGPEPAWLIVLKYKAYEAGELYRPTQIDTEWDGYHFPPPRSCPLESGGCAMDLAGTADRLAREYIAEQADHFFEQWVEAGWLIGLADQSDPMGLPEQRERHQSRLQTAHGGGARLWKY